MKFKLIILILLIPLCLSAELKTTKILGEHYKNDRINRFTLSLTGSDFITRTTYNYLSKNTNLSTFWCKFISGNIGVWKIKEITYFNEKNDRYLNTYNQGLLNRKIIIEYIVFESERKKQLKKIENIKCYE